MYEILAKHGVEVPKYAILNREEGGKELVTCEYVAWMEGWISKSVVPSQQLVSLMPSPTLYRMVGLAPRIFRVGAALHQQSQIWTGNMTGLLHH